MDKNQERIDVLLDSDNTIIQIAVNGAEYIRRDGESVETFFNRVENTVKVTQGIDLWSNWNVKTNKNLKIKTVEQLQKENAAVKPIEKKGSSFSLKKRIAAAAVAACMALGLGYGSVSLAKHIKNNAAYASEPGTSQSYIDEDNADLAAIYEELAQYKDGQKWIERLQAIDKHQEDFNTRALKYPDADGDHLYIKAEEAAAIDSISNATNMTVPSTLPAEEVWCLYLDGSKYETSAILGSGKTNDVEKLIVDKETYTNYNTIEDAAQDVLDGKEGVDKKVITAAYEHDPVTRVHTDYVGVGTALAIEGKLDVKSFEDAQKEAVHDNSYANKLLSKLEAKEDMTKKLSDKYMLVQEALKIMDEKNIKVKLEERADYNISTTDRMKKLVENMTVSFEGGVKTYTYTTTTGKRVTMSEKEFRQKYGNKTANKLINEANKRDKIVDTDGDGKADATLDEAQKISNDKKEQVYDNKASYEKGRADGVADGRAGRGKSPKSSDSFYLQGYNSGYASGHREYQASKEEGTVIEHHEEYHPEPTTQPTTQPSTQPSTQSTQSTTQSTQSTSAPKSTPAPATQSTEAPKKVESVERDGEKTEVNESDNTSKVVRSRSA